MAAVHRASFCVDMEGFTAEGRTDRDRREARAGLYRALRRAFRRARVPWLRCYKEDRGDGVLILIPPRVPKDRLVEALPQALADAIADHNAGCGEKATFRLRAVVHEVEVSRDRHGVVGHALNRAYRLLETPELKQALRDSKSAVLALIASEWFFENVIRQDPAHNPEAYRQLKVAVKETRSTGRMRLFTARTTITVPPSQVREPGGPSTLLVLGGLLAVTAITAAGEIPPDRCDVPPAQLRVLPSAGSETLIRSLAGDFEASHRSPDGCRLANVRVIALPELPDGGGTAESVRQGWLSQSLGEVSNEVDVWLPDSSLDVDQVHELLRVQRIGGIQVQRRGSIARSPLVVAMPPGMADDLGLSDRTFNWAAVPSWTGPDYRVGRPNPRTSSVGLAATVALYLAALDSDVLTGQTLGAPSAAPQLHGVEDRLEQTDDEAMNVLCAVRRSARDSEWRRTAFFVTEKALSDYREGEPLGARCSGAPPEDAPELVPLYAAEATPVLDHPYVVINRDVQPRSPARQQIIEDFLAYLLRPQTQQRIRDAGFRDTAGAAQLEDPLFADRPAALELAGIFHEESLLQAWDQARKSAKVLFALDVSRAMDAPFPYVRGTRLMAAADAILFSLPLIGDRDEIGLWSFAEEQQRRVPLGPPVAAQRQRLEKQLTELPELPARDEDAALYATIASAARHLREAGGGEGTTKAVVVLADGDDPTGLARLNDLIDELTSREPVRVYAIVFRSESCAVWLDDLTRETGGTCYDVETLTAVRRAVDGIAAGLWGNPAR